MISHMKDIFLGYGWANILVTDNGPCFNSTEFRQGKEDLGVYNFTRSQHYHQSSSLSEKYAQPVKCLLSKAKETGEDPHFAPFLYRNTALGSGLQSPTEILCTLEAR